MVSPMSFSSLPSIKELESLEHDAQHSLLCQWARDARVHQIEQNGSLDRIEKKVNTLQILVIVNVVFLVMQFPEEIRTWVSLLKSLF